jgi:drug/metabolite transporter (DMT)-like permease
MALWGSTFAVLKVAWREVDPIAFNGIRFSGIVLLCVLMLAGQRSLRLPRARDLGWILAAAVVGCFIAQVTFVVGLSRTTAIASAVLTNTHPLFAALLLWALTRRVPTRRAILGLVLGLAGVVVFLEAWHGAGSARVGDLLSLAAAVCYGLYSVATYPLTQRYSTREVMAYTFILGGLLVVAVSLPAMARQDWTRLGPLTWGIVVYTVVVQFYLAYAIWSWAIGRRGVARTVPYGFLEPVFGGILAVFLLHESVGLAQLLGTLLVLLALTVTRVSGGEKASPAEGQVEYRGTP